MNEEALKELKSYVEEVGTRFSSFDREKNGNKEVFEAIEIKILSENTAGVIYQKMPTKKLCLFFFYYVKSNKPFWAYFVPSDSHLFGIQKLNNLYEKIEEYNKKVVLNV